jgi:hypothetical protein
VDLDAASGKETRQPKSIAPSFMGENDPGDLATRPRAPGLRRSTKEANPSPQASRTCRECRLTPGS